MKKVFLDTNVILDLLLDRPPFSDDIALLMEKANVESIDLCVSCVTITDARYLIEKFEGRKSASQKTRKILELVKVENVGESTVKKASESKFKDFEDGVQYFCALESKHELIITRDIKGFKLSKLAILTPTEFLAKIDL